MTTEKITVLGLAMTARKKARFLSCGYGSQSVVTLSQDDKMAIGRKLLRWKGVAPRALSAAWCCAVP
jgi:hypothetical protein